jgi:hypothetical protein
MTRTVCLVDDMVKEYRNSYELGKCQWEILF